eukprot:GHVU01088138.1.p1 GENE.GHVU01088138.1~~GHVU01088138.1.p1  ORF type:complete len:530 (-),score=78.91 GHVU01088138.1:1173-2762(-)
MRLHWVSSSFIIRIAPRLFLAPSCYQWTGGLRCRGLTSSSALRCSTDQMSTHPTGGGSVVAYCHGFLSDENSVKGQYFRRSLQGYTYGKSGLPVEIELLNLNGGPSCASLTAGTAFASLDACWRHRCEPFPGRKMYLIGSSMGGYLAAAYAHRHPERVEAMVLICPAFDLPTALAGLADVSKWQQTGSWKFPRYQAEPVEVPFACFESLRTLERFPSYRCPTTIVMGIDDDIVPPALCRHFLTVCPEAARWTALRLVKDDHYMLKPAALEAQFGAAVKLFSLKAPPRASGASPPRAAPLTTTGTGNDKREATKAASASGSSPSASHDDTPLRQSSDADATLEQVEVEEKYSVDDLDAFHESLRGAGFVWKGEALIRDLYFDCCAHPQQQRAEDAAAASAERATELLPADSQRGSGGVVGSPFWLMRRNYFFRRRGGVHELKTPTRGAAPGESARGVASLRVVGEVVGHAEVWKHLLDIGAPFDPDRPPASDVDFAAVRITRTLGIPSLRRACADACVYSFTHFDSHIYV